MKLRIVSIDDEISSRPEEIAPVEHLLDAPTEEQIWILYKMLADGVWAGFRGESDCLEGIEVLRGLVSGAGAAVPIQISGEQALSPLHQDGDECFHQGEHSYFFINPIPRPL